MPFAVPRLKVRKSKLPYETLDGWQTEALTEFERIRRVGLEVIERDILNSLPDPDDSALIATQAGEVANDPDPNNPGQTLGETEALRTSTSSGKLSKSLTREQEQFAQQVRDFERRLEFDAPLLPALGETTANLILLNLPVEGGELKTDRREGRQALVERGTGKEEIVPLGAVIAIPTINTLALRDALTGKRSKQPIAMRHPKSDSYTLIEGAEEFLAARITSIPAMLMIVHRPRDVNPLPFDTDARHSRIALETKARVMVGIISEHA